LALPNSLYNNDDEHDDHSHHHRPIMKYGEHLKSNIAPEYGPDSYLAYDKLDEIIMQLNRLKPSRANETSRVVSLTAPPQTNAQGLDTSKITITEEDFMQLVDHEMVKVEKFTLQKVTEIRNKLIAGEESIRLHSANGGEYTGDAAAVTAIADTAAKDFLRLELYVNLNFMGFHKILKKHDKHLKNNPCKAFYVGRLHNQAWVRGDYSDIVVRLSNLYAAVRRDPTAAENKDEAQSFLRSTTKYWVKTEDVSRVKYAILRHLPVFLQKTSSGESGTYRITDFEKLMGVGRFDWYCCPSLSQISLTHATFRQIRNSPTAFIWTMTNWNCTTAGSTKRPGRLPCVYAGTAAKIPTRSLSSAKRTVKSGPAKCRSRNGSW
jgi:SPX domain protein involved in polyphosphate accumulation